MNEFRNYLLNCLEDEKDTIIELLNIDNNIMLSNITYDDIKNIIVSNNKLSNLNCNSPIDWITDGSINYTIDLLDKYFDYINNIYINNNYVALNSWIVKKANEFYDINTDLNIKDIYIKNDNKFIILGDKVFTEEMMDTIR